MATKGLTKKLIISETVKYIEENGESMISLHELARRLGVKTPSLYNHIKNTKELQYEVFQYAIEKFVKSLQLAIGNKQKDEAVRAFAEAYYSFAMENKGLYHLIMSIPSEKDDKAKEMAIPLLKLAVEILSNYGLSEESIVHWQRVFRAILHGFVSEQYLGYFYFYKDVDLKKSRDIAIQCYLDGLHKEITSLD